MSAIGAILSTARSAIAAHQAAVQVLSHNIANAQTSGYSRQRAIIATGHPTRTPLGNVGTGVVLRDFSRVRDTLLDVSYRRETGHAAGFGLRRDLLQQLESVFGEPSEQGIGATIDAFWSAWSDLAMNPGNDTARAVVKQRGEQLGLALNQADRRIDELQDATRSRARTLVGELNRLAEEVAGLNERILVMESGGKEAADLRDARDRAVDAMAGIAGIRTVDRADGSVGVYVGSVTLVDGKTFRSLSFNPGPPAAVLAAGLPDSLSSVGGALGAALEVLNADLRETRDALDTLARRIVEVVNELHMAGWSEAGEAHGLSNWDPDLGPTGSRIPFFDPDRVTAGSIALSVEVLASHSVIAATRTRDATGANDLALELAALRDQPGTVGDVAFGDYYRATVTDVGLRANFAARNAEAYETLAQAADMRRQGVSGVSVDEELIKLVHHQQSYVAATRLLNAVDEMMKAVLTLA